MFLKRFLSVGAALAFTFTAGAACAEDVVIKYSSWLPVNHWLNNEQFGPWFKEVEKVTEGRVKVEMLPKTVGTALSTYDVVRDGLADMAFVIPSYSPGRFPLIEMGELPLLGEDGSKMSLIFGEIYREHFMPLGEFDGVKVLDVWNIVPMQPFNNKHPVKAIADFKGLKMRSPNPVITAFLNATGGVPILKSSMEAFEMLSSGAIDGQMTQADTVVVNNATELMKFGTVIPGGLSNSAHIMAINQDVWNRISPDDQKAIEGITLGKLGHAIGSAFYRREVDGMNHLKAAGYQIDEVEPGFVDEFKQVIKPIEDDWIAKAKAKGATDPAAILADFRAKLDAAK